jgi:pyrimidine operon attenuation protein/uracil phosphoribosyltransferase
MSEELPRNIMDAAALKRTVERMAHEILEMEGGAEGLALIGVVRKGDYLAARLKTVIDRVEGANVPLGRLDITLYRDDLGRSGSSPVVRKTQIPFDITGKTIVLVDDVLFTGRTTRAALDAIMDYGRPKAIRFAVLVDRGYRELPIQPDFTGLKVLTRRGERVMVEMAEDGLEDSVYLMNAKAGWVPGED